MAIASSGSTGPTPGLNDLSMFNQVQTEQNALHPNGLFASDFSGNPSLTGTQTDLGTDGVDSSGVYHGVDLGGSVGGIGNYTSTDYSAGGTDFAGNGVGTGSAGNLFTGSQAGTFSTTSANDLTNNNTGPSSIVNTDNGGTASSTTATATNTQQPSSDNYAGYSPSASSGDDSADADTGAVPVDTPTAIATGYNAQNTTLASVGNAADKTATANTKSQTDTDVKDTKSLTDTSTKNTKTATQTAQSIYASAQAALGDTVMRIGFVIIGLVVLIGAMWIIASENGLAPSPTQTLKRGAKMAEAFA